jgi:hypothetical protein
MSNTGARGMTQREKFERRALIVRRHRAFLEAVRPSPLLKAEALEVDEPLEEEFSVWERMGKAMLASTNSEREL